MTASPGNQETRGVIWVCGRCKGAAANLAVLRRRLKPGLVKDLWQTMLKEGAPSYRPCPACHDMMSSFTAKLESAKITLDLCKKCQMIWFDPGELEAMPKAPPQLEDMPEVKHDLALLEAYRSRELTAIPNEEAGHVSPLDESGSSSHWAEIAAPVLRILVTLILKHPV
jgi:Zn-finger nucleic acid-binding protein